MKRKVFLRISNKTTKMDVSMRRKFNALSNGYGSNYYPTITIQLNLDIPDEFFDKAQKELDLKIDKLNINSDIKVVEEEK
jgi:hypothetical protein